MFRATSERGNSAQRGFNHANEGKEDEHWVMQTGGMVDSRALHMEKEIFMKSRLS